MSKLISFLFFGPMMAIFPIIIVFIGIKQHYFDALGITVFYNHIFFANFPLVIFLILAVVFSVVFVVFEKMQIATLVTIAVIGTSMVALVPSVGYEIGQKMYETKPFTIKHGNFVYKGVLQYESVNFYYLLDDDANRTIQFIKGEVIEAH